MAVSQNLVDNHGYEPYPWQSTSVQHILSIAAKSLRGAATPILLVQPTGGGKSSVRGVGALLLGGCCLIVSFCFDSVVPLHVFLLISLLSIHPKTCRELLFDCWETTPAESTISRHLCSLSRQEHSDKQRRRRRQQTTIKLVAATLWQQQRSHQHLRQRC